MRIKLKINGKWKTTEVNYNTTLLEVLRDHFNIISPKEGCGKGECGACTVILNGKTVTSCLVLAFTIDNGKVITLEGITPEKGLHPIQEGLIKKGGIQCGFCTPGFILSGYSFFEKHNEFSLNELKRALSGNLCRCTGYKKIVDGMVYAAKKMGKRVKNEK